MGRVLTSLICAWLLMTHAVALAQQSASSAIVGQVTDSTQAALPGTTLTVTNVGTNAQRTTVTDAEGLFSFPNLPPATYRITATLQGFAEVVLEPFALRFGETARRAITAALDVIRSVVAMS